MKILLFSVLAITIIGVIVPYAFAEQVPDWVKNTAGWWAEDAISEKEFVNAIEYLVEEEIIQVVYSYSGVTSSQGVPDWVKNTAGWWAEDAISEKEFVNAIEYLITSGIISIDSYTDNFFNTTSWSSFDFSSYGVGTMPEGYRGLISDGKYIYFSPYYSGIGRHGEVLRYDTTSEFTSVNAWSTFDAALNGVGALPIGFQGIVFDGKYVYFVPYSNNKDYHGEVLRYDTTSEFTSVNAWSTFDAAVNGVGNNPRGYEDAVFDGKYVYFVPYRNELGFIMAKYYVMIQHLSLHL